MPRLRLKCLLLLSLLLTLLGCRAASTPAPTVTPWRTSTPEEQGMDSAQLAAMLEAVEARRLDLDSVLVIRNGAIVVEAYYPPYHRDTKHDLYSCTKSFSATLVGIAIDQGHIVGVGEPVLSLLPGRTFEAVDARKEAMTVEDLLTMTSGLDWPEGDPTYQSMYRSPDWVHFVLDRPMAAAPGTAFNYNSGASHVLSAIVQQATGTPTLTFAQEYLFGPLGIDAQWEADSQGIAIGGWGLELTPRDMARLGLLYLNEGVWEGQRIVSAEWVRAATTRHVDTGDYLGYGYQWWTYPSHGGYAALGRGGQAISVLPEERIVVVFTAGSMEHRPQFDLIEEFVAPAAVSDGPLPANPEGQAALRAAIEAAGR